VADGSVRVALDEAALAFVALVSSIDPDQLGAPGTGEWTVAELIGHAARAFVATQTVLDTPVDPATRWLAGAADYYRVAMSHAGVHAGITQRARAAGAALGPDPAAAVRADADRVLPRAAATPLDLEVQHAAGRLAFGEYLRTRVVELVLHSVDLSLALGVAPSAPEHAAALTRDLMVELVDRADPLVVASVLTGRRAEAGCNVLG
jgi:uncharacterized protein (TIGR03083 family)